MDLKLSEKIPKISNFTSTIHSIKIKLDIKPKKEHFIDFIDYSNTIELRKDFVENLFSSIVRYVYSRSKHRKVYQKLSESMDGSDAMVSLVEKAKNKFRKDQPKGQFSELLLYNLLIHHYKAIPVVRKMPITTNPNLERNGADAIHISQDKENGLFRLYLGEAKTYSDGFKPALKKSIKSISSTFKSFRNELNLYKYEDFIEPELENVVQKYLNNELKEIEIELVCIITYEQGSENLSKTRKEIHEEIKSKVISEVSKLKDSDYPEVDQRTMLKINYILFPINKLDEIISEFDYKLK